MIVRHALRKTDSSTDRFWWIAYEGTDVATFYGRAGTTGKALVRRFASEADCQTQAERDLHAKLKKGYVELPEADASATFDEHRYLDSEFGLHRLTSHPRFVEAFDDARYYDPNEEEAPVGNDAGHDALTSLQEETRGARAAMDFRSFPERLVRDRWGMTFVAPAELNLREAQALVSRPRDGSPRDRDYYQTDQVVVATAVGQAKITGRIDPELRASAVVALGRLIVMNEAWSGQSYPGDGFLHTMADDLRRFA
ncbi:WGR domain-containing protein [Cellulomonas sp. NPDC089187]|uniref:WGR domain-containing protein n=1 Tax=Cellulomonas sp. NPDC089187 TaxID=3154970 RepID=UPI00344925F1